ncbi:DUF2780 domain-containing protein [Gilvimarinus algae]|uniref:DUF2780 domain-containing protein n=1 Tax=Gilvimarinus algae TaxID=3058037 RepID=A0ABT8THT9_9GAMM|nr:DUF2780 domain-containing protein [Gilvimarinus sp. SDUM040014]MDO3383660.1 DUF2780 domain-containing protein [Gilvimarinus sp. SDUM040014]
MKTWILLVLGCALALNAAALDLGDVEKQLGDSQVSAPAGLLNSLTEQLGISTEQAAGGTSALLAMAANNLSEDNAAKLSEIVPTNGGGLTSQLVNQISSMDSVKAAFGKLGMDPALISQFTPVIMDYIGNNGGKELLGKLSSLWSGNT